jgi:hypothetical protein
MFTLSLYTAFNMSIIFAILWSEIPQTQLWNAESPK